MRSYYLFDDTLLISHSGNTYDDQKLKFSRTCKTTAFRMTDQQKWISWTQTRELARNQGKMEGYARQNVNGTTREFVIPKPLTALPCPISGLTCREGWKLGGKKLSARIAEAALERVERNAHFRAWALAAAWNGKQAQAVAKLTLLSKHLAILHIQRNPCQRVYLLFDNAGEVRTRLIMKEITEFRTAVKKGREIVIVAERDSHISACSVMLPELNLQKIQRSTSQLL